MESEILGGGGEEEDESEEEEERKTLAWTGREALEGSVAKAEEGGRLDESRDAVKR